jgi:putative ABC transport system permease protein
VRVALGATGGRILRLMLTETSVLATSGSVLGVLFAFWLIHLVNLYGPLGQPIPVHIGSLLFALTLAALSTLVAGLLPTLLTTTMPVEQSLKGGAMRSSTSGAGWRNAVVATQLTRSFLNLTRVPAGFQQQHVWTGAIDLPACSHVGDQGWNTQFFQSLLFDLSSLGVTQKRCPRNLHQI